VTVIHLFNKQYNKTIVYIYIYILKLHYFSPDINRGGITEIYEHYTEILTIDISLFYCGQSDRTPLVEQELLTLTEHLSSPPVYSGFRVTRSLVLCVILTDKNVNYL
jgi:hypothetical protein